MAEVKATRRKGVSGAQNALAKPFRLNGWPADWSARQLGVHRARPKHTGTHKVQGAIGGLLAARLGFGFTPSNRLAQLVDESLEEAPTAQRVFDAMERHGLTTRKIAA